MKKHMTQEVAIKSAWMILEGLGFSREINGDLKKTVTAVYESAPAADVVEVVRCRECIFWDTSWNPGVGMKGEAYYCPRCHLVTLKDSFCSGACRKDGGRADA